MILHFTVAFFATTLGAMAGLGGGVIIKPVLDALGIYAVSNVGMLSSFTVLSMAVVSVTRQAACGFQFQKESVLLAAGGVGGGVLGKEALTLFMNLTPSDMIAGAIQSFLLAGLLLLVILRGKLPHISLENNAAVSGAGCLLGLTSSFLGIGGGPINVLVLMTLLGMNAKEAAVNSLFIILLSQSSKITWCMISSGFVDYDLSMLNVMIPGAILGGLLGVQVSRRLQATHIERVFNVTLTGLVLLNIFNGVLELAR